MPEISQKTIKRMREETGYREVSIRADAVNADERTVELAFSSEEPVDRWFGTEILDHNPSSVRMDRLRDGAPLLLNHDPNRQIGVVQSASVSNGVGRAVVKLSRSALGEEVLQDMLDGIRSKVSVGYRIHNAVLEQTGDSGDTYRINDWEPFEVSSVPIPADNTVGVGRSVENESAEAETKAGAMPGNQARKEVVMPDNIDPAARQAELDAATKKGKEDAITAERERVHEIEAIAERSAASGNDVSKLAREAIAKGQDVGEFRSLVINALNERAKAQRSPELGLSDGEVQRFSFMRLLSAMVNKDWSQAGYEREVCEATAKRTGLKAKGALVPTDILSRAGVTTTVAASNIQTDILAQSFIELLRNRMKVFQLGATVLDGLSGNPSLPRLSGGATAYWVAEGGAPTQSNETFDAVTLSPKGVAAEVPVTTQTLIQSALSMEALIRRDIATVIALAIDLAAINGSGAANQPTGILQTSGIGSVAMGANGAALSDFDPLVSLEAALADVNADVGNMAYLANSKVVSAMKKLKTTTGEYLWTNDPMGDYPQATLGSINGYGVARSNQVPSNLTKGTGTNLSALLFGNWGDLLIGEWGALDLMVDPYSGGVGNVLIKALQFVDIGVRHPESFAAITDIIA